MTDFLTAAEIKEYEDMLRRIGKGRGPFLMSGLDTIHKAHAAAVFRDRTKKPVVVVCGDELIAGKLCRDIESFGEERVTRLYVRDFTFYNAEGVSRQLEQGRIASLYKMARGEAGIIVATVDSLMQRCIPKDALLGGAVRLDVGEACDLEEIRRHLAALGYRMSDQVEGIGQFSVRGGILDFYSPWDDAPVRCEFWGDEIDSMAFFDVATQRRLEAISSAVILPTAETIASLYSGGKGVLLEKLEKLAAKVRRRKGDNAELLRCISEDMDRVENHRSFSAADRYMALVHGAFTTAVSYIDTDAIVVLCEPARLAERGKNYLWQLQEDVKAVIEANVLEGSIAEFCLKWEDICRALEKRTLIMLEDLVFGARGISPVHLSNVSAKRLPAYGGSLEAAESDIKYYTESGFRVVVLCSDEGKCRALEESLRSAGIRASIDLRPREIPRKGVCLVTTGHLSAGFEYPGAGLAVITEGQIVKREAGKKRGRQRKARRGRKLTSYADLAPGDLVVHEQYGIGRFVGVFPIEIERVRKDYIKISYQGTDFLYVPAAQLDLVSKYIGGGESVKLSKMGGADWNRAKTRAKGAVKDLAKGLIRLYAERQRREGFTFPKDAIWQAEFEEAFEYEETEDQLKCIGQIKGDMERRIPMDRLLCGDVGYGKTEVALRAVMKCVLAGKQAAILVPTTVLAQQHYNTVLQRFSGYPVKVEILSRFRTPTQLKKTLREIADGAVDIVIGTHKLLQKGVIFKDLGFLVVDEEQRFGVTHKEKLKEVARDVDVLTLSATPIPRTLNMALSGIRDMSTIEEPPVGRHPVQTYVLEYDRAILADAIRRELSRGGQVYYLHNRVENIERTAAEVERMVDGIAVGVAHGQMNEISLAGVMERMAQGDIQVLVCTTIIESGIDIANVNTLIVEDADRLGLAQLHQIRGRVGRGSRHAFAYLTYRQGRMLTELAAKRLSAIREFAEFNSGFKIAMRDLEIRGAGNILGAEQSGHMVSVGYDMYLKLLNEAVLEEKGEGEKVPADCSVDLAVSANIPEAFIPVPEHRLDIYRRIALIRTREEAEDLLDELIDRFGDTPEGVNSLIQVSLLRGQARPAGVSEITQEQGYIRFAFYVFDMERISHVYGLPEFQGRVKILAGEKPAVELKTRGGDDILRLTARFLESLAGEEAGENS